MKQFLIRTTAVVLPSLVLFVCLDHTNHMHIIISCMVCMASWMITDFCLLDKYYQYTYSAILDGYDQEIILAQIQGYPVSKATRKDLEEIVNSYY